MKKQTKMKTCAGVLSTEVDGQAVLMHVEKGIYFGLNDVGALVWRELGSEATIEELCEAVISEFDVETDECKNDVQDLLAQLAEQGLVEPADTSG